MAVTRKELARGLILERRFAGLCGRRKTVLRHGQLQ